MLCMKTVLHVFVPTNLDTKYRSTNNCCLIYFYQGTILFVAKVQFGSYFSMLNNFLCGANNARVQLELSLLHTRNGTSL